jgi:tRNA A37 methylthiotransferase MiaB
MGERIEMNQINEIKSAFVISNGCHECFLDAALVQRFLKEKHGLVLADDIEVADVIILLGCAVMQPKEEQSRELIRIACERKKENSQLIVSGCIAKVRPEVAAQVNNVSNSIAKEIGSLISLSGEYNRYQANFPYQPYRGHKKDLLGSVANHVRQKSLTEAIENNGKFKSWLVRHFSKPIISALSQYKDLVESKIDVWNTETYTIKISTGCRGNCSYCSIKIARGHIRSKPLESVLEEFKTGLQKGYSSFALIGTDIGDYGKDQGKDLLDLLKILIQRPEKFQLRLRNVNPRWIIRVGSEFHPLLRSGKIKYMESPIQHASNRILQLMRRGYRAEDFLDAIHKIKSVCPSLFIKTQAIVGFPSESDEDFRKQLDLFGSRNFDYIDVFRYSDRPYADASNLPGKLPQDLVMKRYRKLFFKSLIHLDYRPIFHKMISHSRFAK